MSAWTDVTLAAAAIAVAFALVISIVAWMSHRRGVRYLRDRQRELAVKTADLRRRNAAAAEIESRYRLLFDSVPVAIIVARLDGSIIDGNQAALALFGYAQRAEFMTVNMKSLYVNPAERERRLIAQIDQSEPVVVEFLMRRRDGQPFPALMQCQAIRDAAGQITRMEGFVTDISEIKRLEAERHKAEQEQRLSTRLQSVGALAAGIAHEINTPMQFVSDSVYFLKTAIEELNVLWPALTGLVGHARASDDTGRMLVSIRSAASEMDINQLVIDANQSAERALEGIRRVTKIIRAMREFAHPDNGEHTAVDINHAIETTLIVSKNVYKEVADVETDLGELPSITCQYGEINQALLNIIVNAAHAVEARFKGLAKGRIRLSTRLEGEWAVIRIADNGTGIPDSVKARIFDPFFTTKEVGKGTGQGLAIVQSVIVARHKGRISVESKLGNGTTFELRLPAGPVNSKIGAEHEQNA